MSTTGEWATVVQAVAAVLQFLAALVLVGITWLYVQKTEKISKASQEQAKAAVDLAGQTTSPYLVPEAGGTRDLGTMMRIWREGTFDPAPSVKTLIVWNAGLGPALNVSVEVSTLGIKILDIPGNRAGADDVPPKETTHAYYWHIPQSNEHPVIPPGTTIILRYSDVRGNHYKTSRVWTGGDWTEMRHESVNDPPASTGPLISVNPSGAGV